MSMVMVDMEGFGRPARTVADQMLVRDGIYAVLRQAFDGARIAWDQCEALDRGDGAIVLVPADFPKNRLVGKLPELLRAGLAEHNDAHGPRGRIRLRMALHAGEVYFDEHGPTSDSLVHVSRLVEARAAREALARSVGPLVVIVSEWFYGNVIRHDPDASPDLYRAVRFETKETAGLAWIYVPGDDVVAVKQTTSVDGARGAVTDRLVGVLLDTSLSTSSWRRACLMTFVDALLAVPTVGRESERRMLLEQLRPEIANAVPYSPQSRHHVLGLVTTCMNYQGGLDELLDLVRALEGQSKPVQQLDETVTRLITTPPPLEPGF